MSYKRKHKPIIKTMTCVGYVRVSTSEQAQEGHSLEAQSAKIRAWAAMQGYTVLGIFEDAGLSGTTRDGRAGLEQALQASTEGTSLVVYSLSRLARSMADMGEIGRQLEAQRAELVSVTESIDTRSATGKMLFQILSVLAEFESNLISERVTMGLAQAKAKGVKLGHKEPRKGGEATRLAWEAWRNGTGARPRPEKQA